MGREVFVVTEIVILKQMLPVTRREMFCPPVSEAENCPLVGETRWYFLSLAARLRVAQEDVTGAAPFRLDTGAVAQIT